VLKDLDFRRPSLGTGGVLFQLKGDRITLDGVDLSYPDNICLTIGGDPRNGVDTDPTEDTVIRRSRIHGCGSAYGPPKTQPDGSKDSGVHGIYAAFTRRMLIEDSLIYANNNRGIQLYPDADGSIIRRNVLHANGSNLNIGSESALGIYSQNNLIENNILTDSVLSGLRPGGFVGDTHEVVGNFPLPGPGNFGNRVERNCISNTVYPGQLYQANGYAQSGNIENQNPRYVNAAGGDFTLAPGSPCAGKGPAASGAAIPRLVNISTRGLVATGDNIMIGGFIIGGAEPKKVVIRGRGPSMAAFGVSGTLANPAIRLFSGSTSIDFNDNWQTAPNAAEITASGQAPTDTREAAILTTVNPGVPYTVHLTGVAQTTGIAIVEVFELDKPEIPLLNISTRAPVLTGDHVMIGGFIIQGDAAQQVLIIAKGPSLGSAPFNVAGSLPDPTLELYQAGNPNPIDFNDNWGESANAAAIQASGNVPTNALESAIIRTLAPGAYTAIVRGKGLAQGIGLVEVYKK